MKWLFRFLRWGLAAVFLYAGLVKSTATEQFFLTLVPFTFLPQGWLQPIARGLPWVEIAVGILTLLGPRRLGPLLVFGLCLIFCAALGWALANGIIVACSCFGMDETPSAAKMTLALGRDVALLLIAAAVFFEKEILRPRPV